ncbi:hypothetical protein [Nesterenkonia suensis]
MTTRIITQDRRDLIWKHVCAYGLAMQRAGHRAAMRQDPEPAWDEGEAHLALIQQLIDPTSKEDQT